MGELGGDAEVRLDKERLIDDFVFLTFLVGNDFLPHLPTLRIGDSAFDVIFDAYKRVGCVPYVPVHYHNSSD